MSKEIEDNLEELRRVAKEKNIDLLNLLKKQKDGEKKVVQHDAHSKGEEIASKNSANESSDESNHSKPSSTTVTTAASVAAAAPKTAKTDANTRETSSSNQDKESLSTKVLEESQDEAWNSVLLARHSSRPNTLYYINEISERYIEFHGDRKHGDDNAMVGGLCTIGGIHFTFIGNQKGTNLKENLHRNYGMAHPEGYRKALRLAKEAERFGRPLLSFIDTSGAFPGLASEERGIGEAIAENIMQFSVLETPIICIIIGEGGSGGALGIGIGDSVCMLENSVYSVISPEGFASILLRDAKKSKEAAHLMKMRAQDVLEFGFIDKIIPEPQGGAHINPSGAAALVRDSILRDYADISSKDMSAILKARSQKIINYTRGMGDEGQNPTRSKFFSKIKTFFEG